MRTVDCEICRRLINNNLFKKLIISVVIIQSDLSCTGIAVVILCDTYLEGMVLQGRFGLDLFDCQP